MDLHYNRKWDGEPKHVIQAVLKKTNMDFGFFSRDSL